MRTAVRACATALCVLLVASLGGDRAAGAGRGAGKGVHAGEAIALGRGDVDLHAGVITIRHAKFDRERLVPLHLTVTGALGRYAAEPR